MVECPGVIQCDPRLPFILFLVLSQKPENIMLAVGEDYVPEVRLADFGSAFRQHGEVATARAFTRAYRWAT